MKENKTRTINVKVTPEVMRKLDELVAVTSQETNIKIAKSDMIAKLICDTYDSTPAVQSVQK